MMLRFTSLMIPSRGLRPSSFSRAAMRFITDRSEASFSRRIYSRNGNIEFGPPTYTLFTDTVCLTMKLRNDENLGYKVMLFTGMTRESSESRSFEKKSRVSSVLPIAEVERLYDALSGDSTTPTTLQGVDGGNIIVTRSEDSISLKLCPSLIPGINVSSLSTPYSSSSKIQVNFSGGPNEHSLLLHALNELKEYHQ